MTTWTEEAFLDALRSRGARRLRAVNFRRNRRTIWSLTQGGSVLNLHVGFRSAPPHLLDHFAVIANHPRGGPPAARIARDRVRAHPPLHEALRRIRTSRPPRGIHRRPGGLTPGPNCATPGQQEYLEALYRHLAATAFHGLPPCGVPLRLSQRMRSTLGWVSLGERDGARRVGELALNLDLMLEINDALRLEVVLHEMAHIEAWILHADRGHGAAWKAIARRVGCRPRARGHTSPVRRRDRSRPVERVPPLPG